MKVPSKVHVCPWARQAESHLGPAEVWRSPPPGTVPKAGSPATVRPDAPAASGQEVRTREEMEMRVRALREPPVPPQQEEGPTDPTRPPEDPTEPTPDPTRPTFDDLHHPYGRKPSATASGQRQEQQKSENEGDGPRPRSEHDDSESERSRERHRFGESDEERERARNRPRSRGSDSSDYQTAEEDSRSAKSNPMGADFSREPSESRDATSESSRQSSGAKSAPRKRQGV